MTSTPLAETQADPIVSDELSQIPNYSNRWQTINDVHLIRADYDQGYSLTYLAEKHGTSKSTIKSIGARETYPWLPEKGCRVFSQKEINDTLDDYKSRLIKCNHSGAKELK
jgi:uncharacterized protein YjcR